MKQHNATKWKWKLKWKWNETNSQTDSCQLHSKCALSSRPTDRRQLFSLNQLLFANKWFFSAHQMVLHFWTMNLITRTAPNKVSQWVFYNKIKNKTLKRAKIFNFFSISLFASLKWRNLLLSTIINLFCVVCCPYKPTV